MRALVFYAVVETKCQWNPDDLIFSLQNYDVFSKWLVFSPSSGPGHLPITQSPSLAVWHMVLHCLVLLRHSASGIQMI